MPDSFDTNADTTTPTSETITVNGKEYTMEALATKIANADAHIQTLEGENAEHITNSSKLMDKLDALEAKVTNSQNDELSDLVKTLKEQSGQQREPEPEQTVSISKDELVAAAKDSLKADQVQQRQEKNFNDAVLKARAAYGDDFGAKVDKIGEDLGMSVQAVKDLAENNPAAWRKLFLPADSQQRTPDTTQSSISQLGDAPLIDTKPKTSFLRMRSSKDQRAEFKRRMDEKLSAMNAN